MIPEPQKPNRNTLWGDWANRIHDWIRSLRVISSPTVKASYTTEGIVLEAIGGRGGGNGAGSDFLWPDEFDGTKTYPPNSTCYLYGPEEMDNGNVAATYYTLQTVSPGDMEPGVTGGVGSLATFEAVIDPVTHVVTDVNILNAGDGYAPSTNIVFAWSGGGGGTGAAGYGTTDADGKFISTTITDGGTDYTEAPAVSVPGELQKWKLFSKFNTQRFTLRKGDDQVVRLDAARDALTEAHILIAVDEADADGGSPSSKMIRLSIADIKTALGGTPGNVVVKLREWSVCVDGENKKALFLSTEPY